MSLPRYTVVIRWREGNHIVAVVVGRFATFQEAQTYAKFSGACIHDATADKVIAAYEVEFEGPNRMTSKHERGST